MKRPPRMTRREILSNLAAIVGFSLLAGVILLFVRSLG